LLLFVRSASCAVDGVDRNSLIALPASESGVRSMILFLSAFHRIAAQRGDGLLPELAELLIAGRAGSRAGSEVALGDEMRRASGPKSCHSSPPDATGSPGRLRLVRRR
jgi:hypothetical protein